jgi:hypothetical protein
MAAAVSFDEVSMSFKLSIPTGLWMYRAGIEIVPHGIPWRVMEILAASVLPIKPDSSWKGIFSSSAVSMSHLKTLG